jgi:hypothetical protein
MGNESLCALAALIRRYRSQQIVKWEMCMQVPDTEANRKSCICDKGDCPTYNQNALSDTLFCAIGASPKIPRRVKCPCNVCPVSATFDLGEAFYCIKGAAKE